MSLIQKILANPEKFSVNTLTQCMNDGLAPAYVCVPIIQQKIEQQKMMQGAGAQPPQGPPVAEQVMQEAMQMTGGGIPQLPSNLPEQQPQGMADGGIVAFAKGDLVDIGGHKFEEADPDPDGGYPRVMYHGMPTARSLVEQTLAQPSSPKGPSMFSWDWQGLANKPRTDSPPAQTSAKGADPQAVYAAQRRHNPSQQEQVTPPEAPPAKDKGIITLPGAAKASSNPGMGMIAQPDPAAERALMDAWMAKNPVGKKQEALGKILEEEAASHKERMSGAKDKSMGYALLAAAQGMGQGRTLGQGIAPAMGAFGKSMMSSDELMSKMQDKAAEARFAHNKYLAELEAGKEKSAQSWLEKYRDSSREEQKFQWMAQNYYGPMARAAGTRAEGAGKGELAAVKAEEQTLLKQMMDMQKDPMALRTPEGKAMHNDLQQQLNATRRKMQQLGGIDTGAAAPAGGNVVDFSRLPK